MIDFAAARRGVFYERARQGMTFAIVSDAEDALNAWAAARMWALGCE